MAVNCLSFDGGDEVDFGNPAAFQITGSLSAEVWVKRSAVSAAELIFSKNDHTGGNGWDMRLGATGVVEATWQEAVGTNAGTTEVDDGIWHHAAITRTTTPNPDEQRVLVDGAVDGSLDETFTITDSGENLNLGRSADLATNKYAGKAADLRLWNVGRSQAQIAANYQSRLVGNESGLVGYWKINEGTGTSLEDLVSTNDGTFGAAGAAPTWATDGPSVFEVVATSTNDLYGFGEF